MLKPRWDNLGHMGKLVSSRPTRPAERLQVMLKRSVTLLLSVFMFLPHVTWAFSSLPRYGDPIVINDRPLAVPSYLGKIRALKKGKNKLVIHIQDFHCHDQIQETIAQLIKYLHYSYGVNLVAIEGARGPLDISKLSTFPLEEIKQQVGHYFIRQGKLSGAELAVALDPKGLRLVGIEDEVLYQQSYALVQNFYSREVEGVLLDLRQAFEDLKPAIYSPELRKWDSLKVALHNGKISFYHYCELLIKAARTQHLNPAPYGHVMTYLATKQASFSNTIDVKVLFQQVRALDQAGRELFYQQDKQRTFDQLLDYLEMIQNLLGISITDDELEMIRHHREAFRLKRFLDFYKTYGNEGMLLLDDQVVRLDQWVDDGLHFYQLADERSNQFVRHTLEAMANQQQSVAVLITGGYHSQHIEEALKQAGVSYIGVDPQMRQFDLQNPYTELIRGYKTPLEKILALNNDLMALKPFAVPLQRGQLPVGENLPQDKRSDYALMDLMLETATTGAVINREKARFVKKKVTAAVKAVLDNYPADNPKVGLALDDLAGDSHVCHVPLKHSAFEAVFYHPQDDAMVDKVAATTVPLAGGQKAAFYKRSLWPTIQKALTKVNRKTVTTVAFSLRQWRTQAKQILGIWFRQLLPTGESRGLIWRTAKSMAMAAALFMAGGFLNMAQAATTLIHYTVAKYDRLSAVARRLGVDVSSFHLANPDLIHPGDQVSAVVADADKIRQAGHHARGVVDVFPLSDRDFDIPSPSPKFDMPLPSRDFDIPDGSFANPLSMAHTAHATYVESTWHGFSHWTAQSVDGLWQSLHSLPVDVHWLVGGIALLAVAGAVALAKPVISQRTARASISDSLKRAYVQRERLEKELAITFENTKGTYHEVFSGNYSLLRAKTKFLLRHDLILNPFVLRYSLDRLKVLAKEVELKRQEGLEVGFKQLKTMLAHPALVVPTPETLADLPGAAKTLLQAAHQNYAEPLMVQVVTRLLNLRWLQPLGQGRSYPQIAQAAAQGEKSLAVVVWYRVMVQGLSRLFIPFFMPIILIKNNLARPSLITTLLIILTVAANVQLPLTPPGWIVTGIISMALVNEVLIIHYLDQRRQAIKANNKPAYASEEERKQAEEVGQLAVRKKIKLAVMPIYMEMMSDLKLAIGLVPIVTQLSPDPTSWTMTFVLMTVLLGMMGVLVMTANIAMTRSREKRWLKLSELFWTLIDEWKKIWAGMVQDFHDFLKNKAMQPHTTLLAVGLFIMARMFDYSSKFLALGSLAAIGLYAGTGVAMIFVAIILIKNYTKDSDWLEKLATNTIKIVAAVVLIEVSKFPAAFFMAVFLGNALGGQVQDVSLKMFKKVAGILSFAQFFLNVADFILRKQKLSALPMQRADKTKKRSLLNRIWDNFQPGQPIRDIAMFFAFASLLFITYHISPAVPLLLSLQLFSLIGLITKWLTMSKNFKVNQTVKITTLASLIPASLLIFSMVFTGGLAWIGQTWPALLPEALATPMVQFGTMFHFLNGTLVDLSVFVVFMYSLLGFSSVLKDQDKISKVSEVAYSRTKTLQQIIDHYIEGVVLYIYQHPGVTPDMARLRQLCKTGHLLLVPKKAAPSWMGDLIKSGIFSFGNEIYIRRRVFNLVSDRTVAGLVIREGLLQAGLPIGEVRAIVEHLTHRSAVDLALLPKKILESKEMEMDTVLAFERTGKPLSEKKRAKRQYHALQWRYNLTFETPFQDDIQTFCGNWGDLNNKIQILLLHGITPHPFFLKYEQNQIEAAAKILEQQKKPGRRLSLGDYKWAMEQVIEREAAHEGTSILEVQENAHLDEDSYFQTAGSDIKSLERRGEQQTDKAVVNLEGWALIKQSAINFFYRHDEREPKRRVLRLPWLILVVILLGPVAMIKEAAVSVSHAVVAINRKLFMQRHKELKTAEVAPETWEDKKGLLRQYGLPLDPFFDLFSLARLTIALPKIKQKIEEGNRPDTSLYVQVLQESQRSKGPGKGHHSQKHAAIFSPALDGQELGYLTEQAAAGAMPVKEELGFWGKVLEKILMVIIFEENNDGIDQRQLRWPWSKLGPMVRGALAYSRLLLASWLTAPAHTKEVTVDETQPAVRRLLLEAGLPDVMTTSFLANRAGFEIKPVHLAGIKVEGRLPWLKPAYWQGYYQEEGRHREPTIYVPNALLDIVLNRQSNSQAGWQAWIAGLKYRALRWYFKLVLQHHRDNYYAQKGQDLSDLIISQRRQALTSEYTLAPLPASSQTTKVKEQYRSWFLEQAGWLHAAAAKSQTDPLTVEAYRHPQEHMVLGLYDLVSIVEQELAPLKHWLNAGSEPNTLDVEALLQQQAKRGADISPVTLLHQIPELQQTMLSEGLQVIQTALQEAQTTALPQALIRQDSLAYLVQHQASRSNHLRLVQQVTDYPQQVSLLSMPQTARLLITMIDQWMTKVLVQGGVPPQVLEQVQYLTQLKIALQEMTAARPGTLIPLAPSLGHRVWDSAAEVAQEEQPELMSLGQDLNNYQYAFTNGRVNVMEIGEDAMLVSRQVVNITSLDKLDSSIQALSLMESGAVISEIYQGRENNAESPEPDSFWLDPLKKTGLHLVLLLPGAWQQPYLRFWLSQDPALVAEVQLSSTPSPLAGLLRDHRTPLRQLYERWARTRTEDQLTALVRAMIRVIAHLDKKQDIQASLETLSGISRLPGMHAEMIGKWLDKESKHYQVFVPGVLLQPGQGGALGALIDVLNPLPVQLEKQIGEHYKRRLFRDAAQAA